MSDQDEQVTRKIERREHVRLSEPRILPLNRDEFAKQTKDFLLNKSEWDKLVKETMEGIKDLYSQIPYLNVFATTARYKELRIRSTTFNSHIMNKSSLPDRDKEILILRMAWICHCEYMWGHHVIRGKMAGLSDDEISRIMEGPDADGWAPFDATLLCAVDELYTDTFITDKTWKTLAERYNTHQLMDLVATVGFYNNSAMSLNTYGVQLEEGVKGFPE